MSDKIPIICPRCSQRFSADLPICEIVNTENFSMVVAHHPLPISCPNSLCKQKFRLAIAEVGTGWSAQPMAQESLIALPHLKVVNRG